MKIKKKAKTRIRRSKGTPCVHAPGHTILYCSGSSHVIEDHILKKAARMGHVGVLLSYFDLKARGVTWRRLEALKEKYP